MYQVFFILLLFLKKNKFSCRKYYFNKANWYCFQ